MPIIVYIIRWLPRTDRISFARTMPKLFYITQPHAHIDSVGVSGQKVSESKHFDLTNSTNGLNYSMKTKTSRRFFMNDRIFTDFEEIAIENALEHLVDELRESADPEFSVSLENVVFAYDLDEDMEQDVKERYDNLTLTWGSFLPAC
jgi:hypothetical protein